MMRMMPTSPPLWVDLTAAGLPPLDSAHLRMVSWSVVVSAIWLTPRGTLGCTRAGERAARRGGSLGDVAGEVPACAETTAWVVRARGGPRLRGEMGRVGKVPPARGHRAASEQAGGDGA